MPATKRTGGNSFRHAAAALVGEFQERRPLRTGSLVISIFGDAIAVHGNSVWLGSLINVLEPFGINQRLVRTSVFRLEKDGWLEKEQIGRRSYYTLTQQGRARFHDASRRIYSGPRQEWSGSWCLVLLAGVDAAYRDNIRKELRWLGFAPFSLNVLAHPAADLQGIEERLEQLDGNDQILIMEATANNNRSGYLRKLVLDSWSLQELDERYTNFLECFRPLYKAARTNSKREPELAFRVRILLIHEYRKILLRDPFLPSALLPEHWKGMSAYQLCRNIYSLIAGPAERFLAEVMENADGPLPPADPLFYDRFGGLKSATKAVTRKGT